FSASSIGPAGQRVTRTRTSTGTELPRQAVATAGVAETTAISVGGSRGATFTGKTGTPFAPSSRASAAGDSPQLCRPSVSTTTPTTGSGVRGSAARASGSFRSVNAPAGERGAASAAA